jgi:hypothetical protein
MIKKLLLTICLSLMLFLYASLFHAPTVSAHQSGCHRWHSCPSDTGSYTCGDTGHSNYCGTTPYIAPNYKQQGITNGAAQAKTNSASINSAAQLSGRVQGQQDGVDGSVNRSSSSNASTTCDRAFSFSTPQTDEYKTAFHDSYLAACATIYNASYTLSYDAAYAPAHAQAAAVHESESSDIKPASEKKSALPAILAIIMVFIVIGVLVG